MEEMIERWLVEVKLAAYVQDFIEVAEKNKVA